MLPMDTSNAGTLPAFVDYTKLGSGYAHLLNQLLSGQMVHAYLISGSRGVGKATFSRYLAATQFCEQPARPCGHCDACHRVFTGGEPDVLEIKSQDDKIISIDRIREAITQISQHSLGNGPRVVIVEPAEKLTPAAQNCLLKSLEDPPANVIFFLLAHEPSALLGTIASRCVSVKLTPWPDDYLKQTLLMLGADALSIDATLPRASGNIGVALTMLRDQSGESELQAIIEQALLASRDADIVALSTRLKDDRDGAEHALRALEQALQLALQANTGLIPVNILRSTALEQWAKHATPQDISGLLQAVFDTRKRRMSQVNWQASIDRLLMKIVEAKTKWQQS